MQAETYSHKLASFEEIKPRWEYKIDANEPFLPFASTHTTNWIIVQLKIHMLMFTRATLCSFLGDMGRGKSGMGGLQ